MITYIRNFLVGFALGAVFHTLACETPADRSVKYATELEACLLTSSNCGDYVQCRQRVANDYGRPFSGVCDADGSFRAGK